MSSLNISEVSAYTAERFYSPIERQIDQVLASVQKIATEVTKYQEQLPLIVFSIYELLQREKHHLLPDNFLQLEHNLQVEYVANKLQTKITDKMAELVLNFYKDMRMW